MTYRVWYRSGAARLVDAETETEARGIARELGHLEAVDIKEALGNPKATEETKIDLIREYKLHTTIAKVERL